MKRVIALFLVLAFTLSQSPAQAGLTGPVSAPPREGAPASPGSRPERLPQIAEHVPGALIVKYKELEDPAAVKSAKADLDRLRAEWGVTGEEPALGGMIRAWEEKLRAAGVQKGFTTKERSGWYWYAGEKDWMKEPGAQAPAAGAPSKEETEAKRLMEEANVARAALEQYRLQNIRKLSLSESADMGEAARAFAANPAVEYAHPDYLMRAQWTPNDPYYSTSGAVRPGLKDQWPLDKISAGTAWDLGKGNSGFDPWGHSNVVAVIDTGVDYNHPELAANGRIWINPLEWGYDALGRDMSSNGVDDDGNGYVDDWRGYDFASGDNDPMDDNGHGTHLAGIISAVTHNNRGIAGVLPYGRIMALKALNADGVGTVSSLFAAIAYASSKYAGVINLSWGARVHESDSLILRDVIAFARAGGAVVVAAAGNDGMPVGAAYKDPEGFYPAALREVICVASSDDADSPSAFSNRGAAADPIPTDRPLGAGRINARAALVAEKLPVIRVNSFSLEEVEGDGDQIPESNELVRLVLELENIWAGASSVTANLSSHSPAIASLPVAFSDFGAISAGGTASNAGAPFRILLRRVPHADTPAEVTVVVYADGRAHSFSLVLPLGVRKLPLPPEAWPRSFPRALSASDTHLVWEDGGG